MKYMIPGHVEMVPNPDYNVSESSEALKSEQTEVLEQEVKKNESIPRCLPRFVSHKIQKYDYSKLPQQPIPLPTTDSVSTICSQSCRSDLDFQAFGVESPILISADQIEYDL